jgi:NitT/TauT family transport system substrate-binding protein
VTSVLTWVLLASAGGLACGPGATSYGGGGGAATAPPAASGAPGSSSSASGVAPAAAPTAPPPLRPIDVPASSSAATVTPFYLAVEKGLFQKHGLEVSLTYMPPATATQALSAGSVLVAATGGSTTSAYVGGATELVYIGGVSNKAPYRVVGRPEITRMEDLRGKSVGLTTPGASPSVVMVEVLRRYGLEADRDVTLTYLRDTQASIAALLTGVVQAVATGSPQAEYAMAEGGRLLLDLRELNIPLLGINVSTTRGTLERDPDLLRRFMMGYIEGIQHARDYPDDAIAATMVASRVDDRNLAELAYLEYRDIWDPWPSEPGIQTILDNLDQPGAKSVRPADLIDERIMRDLERSGWLAQHLRAR